MAKILIADDQPEILILLATTLEGRGHEVIPVASGLAALEAAKERLPDLAILDVNMPDMEGTRVARALRAHLPTATIPIMLLTGLTSESDTLAGFAAGADDYVTKPFRPRELAVRVEALLARSGGSGAPSARPQGRVVAVAGPKGGCGRTTLAVNLALAVRRNAVDQRVALVEGNLWLGDMGVHLDLRPAQSLLDLVPFAGHLDVAAVEGVLARHPSGVEVLLRPTASELAERIQPALFQEAMDIVASIADLVIVDLEARYDEERTLRVLEVASTVLLVVTPELGALRNAKRLLELAPQLHLDAGRVHVVLNRMDRQAGLSTQDVVSALGVEVAAEFPDMGPAGSARPNLGTPVVAADPRADFSRRMQRLAAFIASPSTPRSGR